VGIGPSSSHTVGQHRLGSWHGSIKAGETSLSANICNEGWRQYVIGFEQAKTTILIMTNNANGEDPYSGLLETLITDTFTPLEWEGFRSSSAVA
jgi:hypothetical protein